MLEAAIEGAKVRFRPILMTSFAFVAGMIPLVFATGPGALGNHTIGASSAGGMLLGTIFWVIVVPGLYYIFGTLAGGRKLIRDEDKNPLTKDVTHYDGPKVNEHKLFNAEEEKELIEKNANNAQN